MEGFSARYLVFFFIFVTCCLGSAQASYEDKRCICICPDPSVVVNGTKSNRVVYKEPVAPSKCDCDNVVLPKVGDKIHGHEQEYCPRCECKYESRKSLTIKVVVILVLSVIGVLVVYMAFLRCLDPLLTKRLSQPSYQEHSNEDEDVVVGAEGGPAGARGMAQPLRVRPNVMERVGHQQDKWKRQVQEQRRNIYDKHTMLN